MSLSTLRNSLHAKSAPHHFEQVAKHLSEARARGDVSTCDLKMQLREGQLEEVHSSVMCAYSRTVSHALAHLKPPFPPFDMTDFEPNSVRRVVDWIYYGKTEIPETSYAEDLAVASFLCITMLHAQIERQISSLQGSPIRALNLATARNHSVKGENAYRPYLTILHVQEDTINGLAEQLASSVTKGHVTREEVGQLSLNSLVAVMSAVMTLERKVPLINCAIHWILKHKPDTETINAIVQSILFSDVSFDIIYTVRNSLRSYLVNPLLAGKTELSMSKSGVIGFRIDPKMQNKEKTKTNDEDVKQKTSTTSSPARVLNCTPYRTRSEISDLQKMPDPFIASPCDYERRETTDGFPKYFTMSEVENLRQMSDPFQKTNSLEATPPLSSSFGRRRRREGVTSEPAEQEVLAEPVSNFQVSGFTNLPRKYFGHYPGWSDEIPKRNRAAYAEKLNSFGGKFTKSDIEMMRDLKDPFLPSASSSSSQSAFNKKIDTNNNEKKSGFAKSSPSSNVVMMKPVKQTQPFGGSSSCRGASLQHNENSTTKQTATTPNNGNVVTLSTPSSSSSSLLRTSSSAHLNPPMRGVRKTASEIQEINALPWTSSSASRTKQHHHQTLIPSTTAKTNQYQQSQYMYPH